MASIAVSADAIALKNALQKEFRNNRSVATWTGTGVAIGRNQFSLTPELRFATQQIGVRHGCHTCGTILAIDRDQPWIGDHIPPTNLKASAQEHYDTPSKTILFPQCDECALKQSALVKRLNSTRIADLEDLEEEEEALIRGGKTTGRAGRKRNKRYCIDASGPTVTQSEGVAIQKLGTRDGCHSCGKRVPRGVYHADHVFPQEFCTSYMETIFKVLGLAYPTTFELRPQCPRCSGNQGGSLSSLARQAQQFAKDHQIITYK
ncbi:MAG TPA: hypothetical protein VF283_06160 [Bryobacteraceae bacterium]